jgi:hypothetical protein
MNQYLWLVYAVRDGEATFYGLFRHEANADALIAKYLGKARKQRLHVSDKTSSNAPLEPCLIG